MSSALLEKAEEFWQEIKGLSIVRKPTSENYPHLETIKENEHDDIISNKLVLLSYNINRAYQKQQLKETIAQLMREYNPDIFLLQEVPVYEDVHFWHDSIFKDYNAYFVPFHHVKKSTDHYNFRSSGQLTLAKYSFSQTSYARLSTVTDVNLGAHHQTQRVVSYTQYSKEDQTTIGVYNVHLENGCFPFGRKTQIEEILNLVEEHKDEIIILGGDFNMWGGKRFEKAHTRIKEKGFQDLFPQFRWGMHGRLDYFFVKGVEYTTAEELKSDSSDHNPITAVIKFFNKI